MAPNNQNTVVGVFSDRHHAEQAVEALHQVGFRDDQIGFARRDDQTHPDQSPKEGTKAAGGLGTGAVVGGIIGAAAALLIPGVGPVLAGGILAPILGVGVTATGVAAAGAVAGAAAGGLIGALSGMGIPEEDARYYQGEFESGRTIVTVKSEGRFDEAWAILQRFDAYDVQHRSSLPGSAGH
jgi:hypothetical protein